MLGWCYPLVLAKAGFPTRLTKFDPNSDELVVSLTDSAPVTAVKRPAK